MDQKLRKIYSKYGQRLVSFRVVYYMCLYLYVVRSEKIFYVDINVYNYDRVKSEVVRGFLYWQGINLVYILKQQIFVFFNNDI